MQTYDFYRINPNVHERALSDVPIRAEIMLELKSSEMLNISQIVFISCYSST